jgi:hypothetical protein
MTKSCSRFVRCLIQGLIARLVHRSNQSVLRRHLPGRACAPASGTCPDGARNSRQAQRVFGRHEPEGNIQCRWTTSLPPMPTRPRKSFVGHCAILWWRSSKDNSLRAAMKLFVFWVLGIVLENRPCACGSFGELRPIEAAIWRSGERYRERRRDAIHALSVESFLRLGWLFAGMLPP